MSIPLVYFKAEVLYGEGTKRMGKTNRVIDLLVDPIASFFIRGVFHKAKVFEKTV